MHRFFKILALRCLAAMAMFVLAADAGAVEVPEEYRTGRYRAPTPDVIPGGTLVTRDHVERLLAEGRATFIDVFGTGRFATPGLDGEWILRKPHFSLPGSVWLPNVGTGYLTPEMDRYFRTALERFSRGDKIHPIVFFCEADCWLGWNAAKRAISYGYARVFWYPAGITDWKETPERMQTITPEPIPAAPD